MESYEAHESFLLYLDDISFIRENLENDKTGFWKRSFVRTLITLFEANVHYLRINMLKFCDDEGINISSEFRFAMENKKVEIQNGNLKVKDARNKLEDDIKFTLKQIKELLGHDLAKDFQESGWQKVTKTISVRNRLTHPKDLNDQSISSQELDDAAEAYMWFYKNFVKYMQDQNAYLETKLKAIEEKNKPNPTLAGLANVIAEGQLSN